MMLLEDDTRRALGTRALSQKDPISGVTLALPFTPHTETWSPKLHRLGPGQAQPHRKRGGKLHSWQPPEQPAGPDAQLPCRDLPKVTRPSKAQDQGSGSSPPREGSPSHQISLGSWGWI